MKSNQTLEELALKAFTQSTTAGPTATSLNNLLTTKEQITVGRRILIAQAILAGKTRYEINNHLSVSPNTFAQVRRWLESELTEYTSAYQLVEKRTSKRSEYAEPLSYQDLKRKYPGHFLLVSLVEELFKIKK